MKKKVLWQEVQKQYPDMWAFITDIEEKDGQIISCKLLDVCPKEKKAEALAKYLDSNIKFRCERTTFKSPNVGVLI